MRDWTDLVPEYVAELKKHYDRRRLMWDMYRSGAPMRVVAAKFGITQQRARLNVEKFNRELDHPDPIERFLRTGGTVAAVHRKLNMRRTKRSAPDRERFDVVMQLADYEARTQTKH
jgi:hypothetical protein